MIAQEPEKFSQIRPNIIFILTDDQRFDAIGIWGNPYLRTLRWIIWPDQALFLKQQWLLLQYVQPAGPPF